MRSSRAITEAERTALIAARDAGWADHWHPEGQASRCRECGDWVFWMSSRWKNYVPVNLDGTHHFAIPCYLRGTGAIR